MSRSWNKEELQAASQQMKAMGYLSYDEFCEELNRKQITLSKKDKLSTIAVLCKSADVKEKLYNEAMERYGEDCENPTAEAVADEAYKSYYNTWENIAELIFEVTDEKVDKATALNLAFDKRSEIENVIKYQ